MDILFDTANLDDIERLTPIYPVTGVTTNPSILKKEGQIDFYAHLKQIRSIIGPNRTLHVQVLAKDAQGMIDEAHRLLDKIDANVYPKIPTTEAGIQAMRTLKEEGVKVTATAIYSKTQGFLADRDRRRLPGALLQPHAEPRHRHPRHAQRAGQLHRPVRRAEQDHGGQLQEHLAGVPRARSRAPTPSRCRRSCCARRSSAPMIEDAVDAFISDWKEVHGTTTLP